MSRVLSFLVVGLLVQAIAPTAAAAAVSKPRVARPSIAYPTHAARPAASASGTAPSGYFPCDLYNAYRVNQISSTGGGANLAIAIIDPFHLATAGADLLKFQTQFFPSNPPPLFHQFEIDPATASATDQTDPWADEINEDTQWAYAFAPTANIWLIEAKDASDGSLLAAIAYAYNTVHADVVSMSWSIPEAPAGSAAAGYVTAADVAEHDQYFRPRKPDGNGVTYIAATNETPNPLGWPSDSQRVIAVGGTRVEPAAAGLPSYPNGLHACAGSAPGVTSATEKSWAGSTFGASQFVPRPAYQDRFTNNSNRSIPDISMEGDPDTGGATYSSAKGWFVAGGTSLSAPIYAGLYARIIEHRQQSGQGRMDGPQSLYSLASTGFVDVTQCYSANPTPPPCQAGQGFDAATGRGSPDVRSAMASGHFADVPVQRIVETRVGYPHHDTSGVPNRFTAGIPQQLLVKGQYGVPPSNVTAVVLNVTVVDASVPGFAAVFPGDVPWPGNSNLNVAPGQAGTNLVTAPIGTSGTVGLITSTDADMAIDIFGYMSDSTTAPDQPGAFHPLDPQRVIDTRPGGDHVGPYSTPWPTGTAGQKIDLSASIPPAATAVAINVTAVNPAGPGYLAAFKSSSYPGNSNVNFDGGPTAISNRVIVPVQAQSFYLASSTATDVLVDLNGYYTGAGADPQASGFTVVTPARLFDTRALQPPTMIAPGAANQIAIWLPSAPRYPPPVAYTAVAVNITVTDVASPGFVAVYPGTWNGHTSDLNIAPNLTSSGLVIVKVNTWSEAGGVPGDAYFRIASTSSANVIVDLVGWYR